MIINSYMQSEKDDGCLSRHLKMSIELEEQMNNGKVSKRADQQQRKHGHRSWYAFWK